MTEHQLYMWVVWIWLGLAAFTFVSLFFFTAPYGRHARAGWGPMIERTAAWMIMESPVVFLPLILFLVSDRRALVPYGIFLLIWEFHYVHRTFVFPFRLRGGQPQMPLSIVASAIVFNVGNAYLQARWLFHLREPYPATWLSDPRFAIGLVLFAVGFAINYHSDGITRNLRKPGETGYKIPYGGFFRWVSAPNYLGELIEWTGWAILTWSRGGVVFVIWSAANLVPRAIANHRWYREKFPDYPPERRAIVPGLL
ncbi:MAG: DUF1295 domain-containing protein [bacterium]